MRGEINLGWWQEEGDIGQVARGGWGWSLSGLVSGHEVRLVWRQGMRGELGLVTRVVRHDDGPWARSGGTSRSVRVRGGAACSEDWFGKLQRDGVRFGEWGRHGDVSWRHGDAVMGSEHFCQL